MYYSQVSLASKYGFPSGSQERVFLRSKAFLLSEDIVIISHRSVISSFWLTVHQLGDVYLYFNYKKHSILRPIYNSFLLWLDKVKKYGLMLSAKETSNFLSSVEVLGEWKRSRQLERKTRRGSW